VGFPNCPSMETPPSYYSMVKDYITTCTPDTSDAYLLDAHFAIALHLICGPVCLLIPLRTFCAP
jgi:hypothetical protein